MSKHITPGPWHLRFLIVDKETGALSYLTSNGVGKVVTIESKIDPPKQTWFALPIEGKKNYYKIIQDPGSECPPGLARVEDSNKVILSDKPDEWRLEYVPINIANGDVYKIHPSVNTIGVFLLLGKEGHEAVIQAFPVVEDSPPLPAWQFLIFRE